MAEPTTGERIYAEQVRQLYRLSRPAYLGTLVNSSILVFALWGVVSSARLGAWLSVIFAVTAARYLLYRAYLGLKPAAGEARRWAHRFVIGAGAAGLMWGIAGSALFPTSSLPNQFLVIFLIGGMTLVAMVVLAPVRLAYYAFVLPALVPTTVAVFAQDTTLHLFMGVLMIIFIVVILGTVPIVSEMMGEGLRMRFENSALIAQLSQANRELSERIAAQQSSEEVQRQTSAKFEALIDASPVAIMARDRDLRIVKWNAAAERIFGWSERELLGKTVPFIPPERETEAAGLRERLLRGESFTDLETVRMRKDGSRIHVSISTTVLRDGAGQPAGFISLSSDITERKRAERHRNVEAAVTMLLAYGQSAEEVMPRVLHILCESLGCAYGARWILDAKQQVLRCTETWCEPDPAVEAFRALSTQRVEEPGKPGGLNRRVWATGAPVWHEDLEHADMFRREPALGAGLRSAFAVPILLGGEFYGVMEFFAREPRARDAKALELAQTVGVQIGQFIARKQAEVNLQFFASHDPLTGLFNRSMFSERLQQALSQAARFERSLALLFIDLDGFKLVNDSLGHNAGDAMLSELATRLRATLREGDVIGRMGGDEFVVLIEEFTEAAQVAEVAKKVLETVTRPFVLQGRELLVTASIGISICPDDSRDAQTLLKNADMAMYLVKQQGKNGFRFYSPQMNVHLIERLSLEASLKRAVERGELLLLYQPKIGVRDGRISGVEALVRWQHPTQGTINPAEFVPIAEDTGQMIAIGEWILRTACEQLRAWQQQGLPKLRMAINLSARQFTQESLIQVVREALHQSGVETDRLELEITEGMVIRNPERAAKLLAQLRELGVRLTLDDFGTGYSSLGYLMRCPVDGVKIDHSFVLKLPRDPDSAAVARAVIAMAHSLKLHVTAEGVETREQWEFLRELACDEMQGNYFSAPVPADVLPGIVRRPTAAGQRAAVQALRSRRDGSDSEQ